MKYVKLLTIGLIITILIGMIGIQQVYAKDMDIKDIVSSDETYSTVQWVVEQGYMSLTLGSFFPTKFVKRSEFAAIVTKLSGSASKLQNPKTPSFQDVTKQNQFYKQIETVKNYFIIYKNLTMKLFKPNSNLTREDAMMAIIKVLGYDSNEAVGSNENTDVSLDDVIEDAGNVNPALVKYVAIGVSYELMDLLETGDKLYFDPKKSITRKDLAVLIYNAYQKKDYNAVEVEDGNHDEETTGNQNTGKTQESETRDSSGQKDIVLSQVGQPSWEFTRINWLPVANAANYEVKLYKGEELINTVSVPDGTTSFDFGKMIASNLIATYKATVQAKGTGSYSDGKVSEPAKRTFTLQDFKISDGMGISVSTNLTANTHTIFIEASNLPDRLPDTFQLSLVSTDDVSDYSIMNMVSYHKEHNLTTFMFNGRSGEYYRFQDDNRAYTFLILFDTDMKLLGYYTYQNP